MDTLPGTRAPHLAIARFLYMHIKRSIKDLDKSHTEASQFILKVAMRLSEVIV